ncbi:hypothetical protein ACOMHN_013065 [Nucella lapillus]
MQDSKDHNSDDYGLFSTACSIAHRILRITTLMTMYCLFYCTQDSKDHNSDDYGLFSTACSIAHLQDSKDHNSDDYGLFSTACSIAHLQDSKDHNSDDYGLFSTACSIAHLQDSKDHNSDDYGLFSTACSIAHLQDSKDHNSDDYGLFSTACSIAHLQDSKDHNSDDYGLFSTACSIAHLQDSKDHNSDDYGLFSTACSIAHLQDSKDHNSDDYGLFSTACSIAHLQDSKDHNSDDYGLFSTACSIAHLQDSKDHNSDDYGGGDFDAVWSQHCQDQAVLTTYAQSMKSLAEDHWTKKSKTRIDWCRDTINEYFHGGGLKKVLEKERKRHMRGLRTEVENLEKLELGADKKAGQNEMISEQSRVETAGHQQSTGLNIPDSEAQEKEEKDAEAATGCLSAQGWLPAQGSRLRLLDVGSCYNPFLRFDEFLAVGLDLSPACESVHRCDFLRLHVREPQEGKEERTGREEEEGEGEEDSGREGVGVDVDGYLQSLRSPVESLPSGVVHAVVFSLLLEYLPARRPRWLCCLQAHRLLCTHGLLLVITPDSHRQHRNAPLIRSWRTAIEAVGFRRWRYVKQEHLHCMAFRKLDQPPPYPSLPTSPKQGPSRLEDSGRENPRFRDSSATPDKPDDSSRLPESEGSGDCSHGSKTSDDGSPIAALGDFTREFLGSDFVSRFCEMMYIPQDLCVAEEEIEEEEMFGGEEERQIFFSAAEAELPGFVSEED